MALKKKLISTLGTQLSRLFNQDCIEALAKEHQFVQRTSRLTGFQFALINITGLGSDGFSSLTELCLQLYAAEGILISKQGLDQRYTEASTAFLKSLFLKLLQLRLNTQIAVGHLSVFSGIYVRDATSSQLPPFFSSSFKGSGGSASTAGLKVDLLYDLTGEALSLVFRAGASSDSTCADPPIVAGGLYLQDLGYFKLRRFHHIAAQGGYFISRYKYPTNVYSSKEAKTKVSLNKLFRGMKENEIRSKMVFLGRRERLKVKLVIQRLPLQVAAKRRRKLKEEAKRKGQHVTKARLEACEWTLLITNIEDPKLLTNDQLIKVYTIRWQIEIMFKCWKSILQFGQVHKMKIQRFLSMLYGHMILVVLTMKIIQYFKMVSWSLYEVELSELKLFKAMKIFEQKLFTAIRAKTTRGLVKILDDMFRSVFLLAEKERKKNKPNQLFAL